VQNPFFCHPDRREGPRNVPYYFANLTPALLIKGPKIFAAVLSKGKKETIIPGQDKKMRTKRCSKGLQPQSSPQNWRKYKKLNQGKKFLNFFIDKHFEPIYH
jgi:hypothetical protein